MVAARSSKRPSSQSARRQASAARDPDAGSKSAGPVTANSGKRLATSSGERCSAGTPAAASDGGDGLERSVVAERHLPAHVEEASPGRCLQVAPEGAGPDRQFHVAGVGIAQPEDARVTLGTRTRVAHGSGGLEDGHPPAPARQRPPGGQAQHPGADYDATALVGHAEDHRNAA